MGGSNNLFKVVLNPASLFLKDKQSFWFDPIGSTLTQGVINWGKFLSGEDEFGQHTDWWGTGSGGLGNDSMRKWTEGSKYKQWDAWELKQKTEYAETAKKYTQKKPESILDTHQKVDDMVQPNRGTRMVQSTQDESLLSTSLSSDTYR